jgi:hypothetical protein
MNLGTSYTLKSHNGLGTMVFYAWMASGKVKLMHGFLCGLTRCNFFDAKIVWGVGNATFNLCGAYCYIYLPKPNGSVFDTVLAEAYSQKRKAFTSRCRWRSTLGYFKISSDFLHLLPLPMPNFLRELGKTFRSSIP